MSQSTYCINWSMAAIFHDSTAVIIVVHMPPQAIPPVMITMRKSIHGFPFLSYRSMGLCLVALWANRTPL